MVMTHKYLNYFLQIHELYCCYSIRKKKKKNIVLIIQFIRIAKIKTFLNYDLEKFRKIKKKNK